MGSKEKPNVLRKGAPLHRPPIRRPARARRSLGPSVRGVGGRAVCTVSNCRRFIQRL
ncbi:hypothetical protein J6590_008560 [Homalodisca vitripennis]|nr:hypothetical protein J6590_008560 [Homalodisca vitripennis]